MDDDTRRRILAAVAAIPPGAIASYGEIARRAGLPRRARLVGRVLAELPHDSPVPWHRILNAAGRISLPAASPAAREQRRRLRAEGATVNGLRVRPANGGDSTILDELLWGMATPRSRPRR
jgi:methylated-DNA-protein-cysteine methyltransferase-like protein